MGHHHGENHHSEDVGHDLGAPGEPCLRGLRVHAQPAAVLERNSGADQPVHSRSGLSVAIGNVPGYYTDTILGNLFAADGGALGFGDGALTAGASRASRTKPSGTPS